MIRSKEQTIFAVFLMAMVLIQPSLAIPAEVSILTPQRVNYGQNFTIQIVVDPKGNVIAGMQANLLFNGTGMRAHGVSEGNLFTQNGAGTFFNEGVILNSSINNTFTAILGRYNISTYGVFVNINFTSLNVGQYNVNLSNVKISTNDGVSVPLSTSDKSIKTLYSYDVIGDFVIDIADITSVSQHFGETVYPPYPDYDVNRDGMIDILDIIIVAVHFGEVY